MTRPFLGGGVIAIALLSASLIFNAQTSLAEPLAVQNPQSQQKSHVPVADASGEVPSASDVLASTGAISTVADKNKKSALSAETKVSIFDPETSASGPTLPYVATAYCLRGKMANGRSVAKGFIAADRRVLPLGTRVRLDAGTYSGEYVVADTGGGVRGRRIDIWVPNTGEAMRFGRRSVKLTVLTRVRPRMVTRTR